MSSQPQPKKRGCIKTGLLYLGGGMVILCVLSYIGGQIGGGQAGRSATPTPQTVVSNATQAKKESTVVVIIPSATTVPTMVPSSTPEPTKQATYTSLPQTSTPAPSATNAVAPKVIAVAPTVKAPAASVPPTKVAAATIAPTQVAPTPAPTIAPTAIPMPTQVPPTLAPTAVPTAAPKASTFRNGTFKVGVDIAPGTYRNPKSYGCYWARLSGFGGTLDEILANDNTDGPTVVTILPTDKGFESSRCGLWTSNLSPITANMEAPFSSGTYIVGKDVAPGQWQSSGGEGCYWARLSGFAGILDHIIANDNTDGPTIVQIGPSDAGFTSARCGTWTKIG
jgi:hypothetical protein